MITTLQTGFYKLVETKSNTKILYLDNNAYAWIEPAYLGDILVSSSKLHKTDCVLSMGHYHIYKAVDEANIFDHIHLELEVAPGAWQGYLLLTGLPDNHKKRSRIIPTTETITGNPKYKNRKELTVNLARLK